MSNMTKTVTMDIQKAKKEAKKSSTKRPDRREHRIIKNIGRKQDTPKRTFAKMITIMITGTEVEAIKETAQAIYALQNDHTSGGRSKRKVQITAMSSSDVETILFARH